MLNLRQLVSQNLKQKLEKKVSLSLRHKPKQIGLRNHKQKNKKELVMILGFLMTNLLEIQMILLIKK